MNAQCSQMETTDYLNLSWNSYLNNFKTVIKDLHQVESLSDVTLVCNDGTEIMAHKFVLIGSSPVFRSMLYQSSQRDKTVVYLWGVSKSVLEWVLQFMYLGHTQVPPTKLQLFMDLAKDIKLRGMYHEDAPDDSEENQDREGRNTIEGETLVVPKEEGTALYDSAGDLPMHFQEGTHKIQEGVVDKNHSEEKLNCNECEYSAVTSHQLKHHIEKNHKGVRYPCSVCDHQAASVGNLHDHQAVMHKINPRFRCKICDFCTNHTKHKKIHAERKHPAYIDREIFEIKSADEVRASRNKIYMEKNKIDKKGDQRFW